MSGLLFFGAIGFWGLISIGLGIWLTKFFRGAGVWRPLVVYVTVPLVFFAPVIDEVIAYPQMVALCRQGTNSMFDFAPNMNSAKAYGRTVFYEISEAVPISLWPSTVKILRTDERLVDSNTLEVILQKHGYAPWHGMLNIPNGSGGGHMTLLLKGCPADNDGPYDSKKRLPSRLDSLNLTKVNTKTTQK